MAKNSYSEKLLDPRWQQMRLRVFERDGWKCVMCGDSEKTLHAHHPVYHPRSDGPWDYEDNEIITLCKDCHSYEHDEIESSKANALLAVVGLGFSTSLELDCFCDIISSFTKEELTELFLWRTSDGTNQNS